MRYTPSEYTAYRNLPDHLEYGTSESVLSQSAGSPTFILRN